MPLLHEERYSHFQATLQTALINKGLFLEHMERERENLKFLL